MSELSPSVGGTPPAANRRSMTRRNKTDTAGNEQLIEMTTDAGAGMKPGNSVSIVYLPGNPKKMDLEQPLHTSGTLILAIVGGICALVGLSIIGANIHQSRKS